MTQRIPNWDSQLAGSNKRMQVVAVLCQLYQKFASSSSSIPVVALIRVNNITRTG